MVVTAENIHESEKFKVTKFRTSEYNKEFYVIYLKTELPNVTIDVTVFHGEEFEKRCYKAIKGADFDFDDFILELMICRSKKENE